MILCLKCKGCRNTDKRQRLLMRSFAFLQHIVAWAFVKQICNCESVQFCFWAAVLSKQCNLQTRKPIMYTLSHCIGCTIYTVHTRSLLSSWKSSSLTTFLVTIWARGCCVSYGHNHSSRAGRAWCDLQRRRKRFHCSCLLLIIHLPDNKPLLMTAWENNPTWILRKTAKPCYQFHPPTALWAIQYLTK